MFGREFGVCKLLIESGVRILLNESVGILKGSVTSSNDHNMIYVILGSIISLYFIYYFVCKLRYQVITVAIIG